MSDGSSDNFLRIKTAQNRIYASLDLQGRNGTKQGNLLNDPSVNSSNSR